MTWRLRQGLCRGLLAILLPAFCVDSFAAGEAEYDHDAIGYSTAAPQNAVSRLQERLDAGEVALEHDPKDGWLSSVLAALEIDASSQMLVYSKTSLQRSRISPATPRAIYFNDDVYLGFCRDGNVLEISAADPELGAVFYTLDQRQEERPAFVRQIDNCMACHASSAHTNGVPGHVVRSVYSDSNGLPILSAGSFRIDHTSPIEQRWGGWYVTGTHGDQKHLGNLIARDEQNPAEFLPENLNATDVSARFDAKSYLTPHSDIVALMVLESQTAMHNALTQANYATKRALWDEKTLDEAFGDSPDYLRESTIRRINNAAELVVKNLLFCDEAQLSAPIEGTSGFGDAFVSKGVRDRQGRSLRDLDLKTRLFVHPCHYLIYSAAFEALPGELKERVYSRLHEVLTNGGSGDYAHLSAGDRRAILEILRETKPTLPENWLP